MADPLADEPAHDLIDCDLVAVSGAGAAAYLQGQLSQDIESIDAGSSAMSFLLQPTGHVDAWLRVHRVSESAFVLEVESGHGRAVADRLAKFLIRTKAAVGDPTAARVLRVREGSALVDEIPVDSALVMRASVDWPEHAGVDLVGPGDAIDRIAGELGYNPFESSAAVEHHRIGAGVPRFGLDIKAGSIPAAAGASVVAASVSFTKGCYTGQELVARMNSRGGQAPLVIRRLTAATSMSNGVEVAVSGEIMGVVTSTAGNSALAVLKRKVEPGDSVEVDGARARVGSLPAGPVSAQA